MPLNINMEEPDKFAAIFIAVGKPRSGKSFLVKSLIKQLTDAKVFSWGVCLTSTGFTGAYDYLPENAVWDYDQDKIERYVQHLRDLRAEGKCKPNFLIVDDMVGKVDTSTGWWQNFVSTYRHTFTSIFFTAQYLKARGAIGTSLREYTDYAFLFRTSQKNSLVGLYEAFQAEDIDYDQFKAMLYGCTKTPYHTLCFVNDKVSKKESYLEYWADPVPDFKLKFTFKPKD
jgi:hypothetical protein